MSVIVSFFRPASRSRDWNNQELAEFYRVEASMIRSGLSVVTDRGLSDEGDPWFVFCHAETEDVIVHFARIDDLYVVASPAFGNCVRGRQFRPLIESLIENHPLVIARPKDGGKLFIHPAALLVALVTTCFFKLGQTDAVAAEAKGVKIAPPAAGSAAMTEARRGGEPVILDERAANVVLTAIAVALTWTQQLTFDMNPDALSLRADTEAKAFVVGHGVLGAIETMGLESASGALTHSHMLSATAVDVSAGADAQSASVFWAGSAHTSSAAAPLTLLQKVADGDAPVIVNTIVLDHGLQGAGPTLNSHLFIAPVLNSLISAVPVALAGNAANSFSTLSTASQEISSILGASSLSRVVDIMPVDEQKLVATATSTSGVVVIPDHAGASSSSAPTTTTTVSASTNASSATSAGTQPSAGSSAAATSTMSTVDQAIVLFTAQHPDFQITKMANEVVIFDPNLTSSNISSAVQELFTFQDGSSIFLIGLPATIAH